jgi:hypothetical protein
MKMTNAIPYADNLSTTVKPEGWSADVDATPPGDGATIVDDLRFSLAWDHHTPAGLEEITGIPAARIEAFLAAPDDTAGELLTLAEAARLARVVDLRLLDQEAPAELATYTAVAEHYMNVFGVPPSAAIRMAEESQRRLDQGDPLPAVQVWGRAATDAAARDGQIEIRVM